jgi:hypothetical protein
VCDSLTLALVPTCHVDAIFVLPAHWWACCALVDICGDGVN